MAPLVPSTFHLPGLGDFHGYDDGSRWNGFACPFLTTAEIARLRELLSDVPGAPRLETRAGAVGWAWPGSPWIPAERRLGPRREPLWAVGARDWEWMPARRDRPLE